MTINNPYIEKVQADSDIMHGTQEIYSWQWKWSEYFKNNNDIILEIGTGMGNFFAKQVISLPKNNFVGMEIRYKRLYQSAEKSRVSGNSNFVMLKDFAQNISKIFTRWEISQTYIFFPDPWANKKRQRKNRLLQADFLKDLHSVTKPGGKLYFKTDHREYFDSTREIIENQWLWKTISWTHNYEDSEIFDMENITEFEWLYRWKNTHINYIELAS